MTAHLRVLSIALLCGAAACSAPSQPAPLPVASGAAQRVAQPTFTVFTAGTTPGLPVTAVPRDITAGPGGTIWFTDINTPAIGAISAKPSIREYTAGLRSGAQPYAILAGPDGNIWFSDGAGAIGRITPAGKIAEFRSGMPAGDAPSGLAAGPGGKAIWSVAAGTQPALLHVTLDGTIASFALPKHLSPDGSIAADAGGNVWFFAFRPDREVVLGERTASGSIVFHDTGLVSKGEPCCPNVSPNHIAIGSDGNPWFTTPYAGLASSFYQHVGTFTGGTTKLYTVAKGPIDYSVYPSGIVAAGSSLWFSGSNPLSFDGALWKISTTGAQTPYPIPYDPAGLTAVNASTLWFTSQAAGRAPQIVRAVF